MRLRFLAPLLLIIVVACSSDPLRTYVNTRSAFNTGVNSVSLLAETGQISNKEVLAMDPFIQEGNNILDIMLGSAIAGDVDRTNNLARTVSDLTGRLLIMRSTRGD